MFKKLLVGISGILLILSFFFFLHQKQKQENISSTKISYIQVYTWAIDKNYNLLPVNDLHIIYDAGKLYNIDPLLILAIIGIESRFIENAVSHSGAIGYMQIIPKWHNEKAVNLYRSKHNIYTGTRIFSEYLKQSNGNIEKALQKYNGSKTKYYSNKVLISYSHLVAKVNQ